MTARTTNWVAWAVWVFILGLAVASVVLSGSLDISVTYNLIPVILGGLGLLIATRQRGNPVGWILLAVGCAFALNTMAGTGAGYSQPTGVPPSAWTIWLDWFQSWSWLSYFPGGLVLLFLLLPDGRLPGRRWRWLVWFDVLYIPVLMAATALDPAPLQPPSGVAPIANPVGLELLGKFDSGPLNGILHAPLLLLLALTIAALVLRLVRSRGDERQQLKWIVFASGTAILAEAAASVIHARGLDPSGTIYGFTAFLAFGIILPASFGVAILKHGLYQMDVVISRTLVYGALAAFITAVYVGIVVGIGSLIGSGGRPNLGLSIFATAVVAVGFQPVRDRLQKLANRLVYGRRATPYEVLSEFSERIAETYAGEEVLLRMARVLAEGTAADRAAVWLRSGDLLHQAASWPGPDDETSSLSVTGQLLPTIPEADRAVPVRHQGELLGALSVTKRRGESLTPIEAKLLDDLANQAGLVLRNVGLTAELRARLEELRVSRQRLVAAQDDERRRLERDLHDGAQQSLVALKVKLGLAERMSSRDPEKTRDLISSLKADADEALETLRDLARGIYPPLLADRGLQAALQAQARKATVPVSVEGDGAGRYPHDIEAAVYFCVLEALQNVQKYAGANSVTVRLSELERHLRFEVYDDGRGFDRARIARGAGLTNMDDRLDALGGKLTIVSEVGQFTRVSGSIPIMVAAPTDARAEGVVAS